MDAPRSASERDAERPRLRSHAERGNDQSAPNWPPRPWAAGYKIVNLNLNTHGYPQPFIRPQMMMKDASMDAESVTPEVEAGTSKVTMTADGVVEVSLQ